MATYSFDVKAVLEKLGYTPNPMQASALEAGLLEGGNFIASAATASGKTLLGLLKIIENHAAKRGKAIYIVPLKALANEKNIEFKNVLAPFGISVAVTTGDFDSSDAELAAYDVIISTSEKMDSLLRHKPAWLGNIALVIADELHLVNDSSRGATLEVILTALKRKGANILGLSATIPNVDELGEWLDAKVFLSDWRPTPLEKAVACEGKLYWDGEAEELGGEGIAPLVERALAENKGKGQVLVFVSTRRFTESAAEQLIPIVSKVLDVDEKKECALLAERAMKVFPTPTTQCEALAACLRGGVAFHHAGLVDKDRRLIERGFKEKRCVKAIVATTTLAMGVDYPASWVIVRDVKRFTGDYADFIPNLEAQQMLGRAGRPRYDRRGVGVIVSSRRDLRNVRDRYVLGPLENIYSKLSSEPALRMHCLSLVATGTTSLPDLQGFFDDTLFAVQFESKTELAEKIAATVDELQGYGFVSQKAGMVLATPVGRRVSELYLDPLTAHSMLQFIKAGGGKAAEGEKAESGFPADFGFLLELSSAVEAAPLPRVDRREEQALWEEFFAQAGDAEVQKWEADHRVLEKYKNAKIANAWVNEASEQDVIRDFNLPPGVLHSRMRILEWLAYSTGELAYLLNASGARLLARKMQRRIKYGVKEELLPLVGMRQVGRVRARRLWHAGLRSRDDVAGADKARLAGLLGAKVADKVLDALRAS